MAEREEANFLHANISLPYCRYGCVPLLWVALAECLLRSCSRDRLHFASHSPVGAYRRLFLNRAAVDEELRCRVGSSFTKERLETDINGALLGATKRNRVRMDILKSHQSSLRKENYCIRKTKFSRGEVWW